MTTEQTRTAHTPGPWHVTGSGEHGEMIYADAGRTVAAWPYGGANPPESIEAMANARLIASALALLRIAQMVTLFGPGDEESRRSGNTRATSSAG